VDSTDQPLSETRANIAAEQWQVRCPKMVRRVGGDDADEEGALVLAQVGRSLQPFHASDGREVQAGGAAARHPDNPVSVSSRIVPVPTLWQGSRSAHALFRHGLERLHHHHIAV